MKGGIQKIVLTEHFRPKVDCRGVTFVWQRTPHN